MAFLEDNPNLWQSGVLDTPPTDDWETYKAAYIDMLVEIEGTKAEIERTICAQHPVCRASADVCAAYPYHPFD